MGSFVSFRARWCQVVAGALARRFLPALLTGSLLSAALHATPQHPESGGATREEIVRKWFPAPVAPKSDADAWLSESLDEYLMWRYLLDRNPEAARQMVTRALEDVTKHQVLRPISLGLHLVREGHEVERATLRSRGMLVWRTLETVIGRERVDRGLRELAARHGGAAAAIDDFRKICEEISGRDLKWFFDYYIGGIELPHIELRRIHVAPNEVSAEIIVRNAPAEFQVRVELGLHSVSGEGIRHSVATKGEVTPFTVSTTETVSRITLDPDSRILRGFATSRSQ